MTEEIAEQAFAVLEQVLKCVKNIEALVVLVTVAAGVLLFYKMVTVIFKEFI